MTNEEKMGFREWTAHYEKEQEADRARFNQLADVVANLSVNVGTLSSDVKALVANQREVFNRINRPWQWGVVIAAFVAMFTVSGVFATVLTLSLDPVKANLQILTDTHARDVERNLDLHMWFRESIEEMRESDSDMEARIAWLEKLEERMNDRLHERYKLQ